MKFKFRKIILINLAIFIFLYLFLFIIYPSNSSYFECNQIVKNNILNSNISYSIPVSCDQELYLIGVYDFQSIYKFDYNYQSRPLYILIVKFFYNVLNIFLSNSLIHKFLSFTLSHILIISVAAKFFLESLSKLRIDIDSKKSLILILFLALSPIVKWGVFDSAHQTLTILQFSISFYFLVHEFAENKKIYFYSFILGLLALSNMTFALPLFFLVLHRLKSIHEILLNFGSLLVSFILFIIPVLSWDIFISSMGYDPYNSALEYWHQFIWVKDYLLGGYENINFSLENSEYYCMSIPLFLKCYLNDFLKTILYLSTVLILCLINFKNIKYTHVNLHKKVLVKLSLIYTVSFIFWSFIGWYPPLRFNLYSLGSFVTLLFCFQFVLLKDGRIKNLTALCYVVYFMFLNHWNYLGVLKINYGITFSLLVVSFIIFELIYKKKDITKFNKSF
jgi:hypothetical protein